MSDNGGLASTSEWRDGPLYTQNYPLLSGKGSLCEGGIREPMIVSWPGVAQPNTRCDKYLLIEDFYPTILEMAGVKDYETVQPIDGISFIPLLTGTGDPPKGVPSSGICQTTGATTVRASTSTVRSAMATGN